VPEPSPNFDALRAALSARRAERGMTYDALAQASGLSRTGIINLEVGNRRGSLNTWFSLAVALEVPFGELMQHLQDAAADSRSI
jgi:putative transcriptional regulator